MIKLKDPIWGADPVAGHLLGTDQLGRDILSRLLYGARVTLIVALAGTVVGGIVGVVLGSLAGYYGKWVDAVIMRLVDIPVSYTHLPDPPGRDGDGGRGSPAPQPVGCLLYTSYSPGIKEEFPCHRTIYGPSCFLSAWPAT